MYKELLAELTSGNKWVRLGAPCLRNEIARAENAVGCPFTRELRELLGEVDGDGWALMSAREIAAETKRLRDDYRAFCEDEGRPEADYADDAGRFVFFGKNGCGDFFGYRVGADGLPDGTAVYVWEHEKIGEARCYRPVADNIADFIVRYYGDKIG